MSHDSENFEDEDRKAWRRKNLEKLSLDKKFIDKQQEQQAEQNKNINKQRKQQVEDEDWEYWKQEYR